MLEHIERLKAWQALDLPSGIERLVHQNRLLKIAREGGQMTAQHLHDLEPSRRCATLVAVILDTYATLIDEIIDLHDRFMGALFSKAKRNHADRFQQSGKAINDKVRLYTRIGRALLEAKQSGGDPFAAIEAIIPWEVLTESITEAELLAQPEGFDYLALVGDSFSQLRRYTPALLKALSMKAAPAARELLAAVDVLKGMNERQARKVPDDAPTSFVRAGARWGHERCFQETKSPLGLDHYEVRTWHGWHRHITLVMAAYAFVRRQRQRTLKKTSIASTLAYPDRRLLGRHPSRGAPYSSRRVPSPCSTPSLVPVAIPPSANGSVLPLAAPPTKNRSEKPPHFFKLFSTTVVLTCDFFRFAS